MQPDQTALVAVADDVMLLHLAPGVELVSGPNNTPLLYVGERRTYMRLSPLGAEIVRLMQGDSSVTTITITAQLSQRFPQKVDEIGAKVMAFLQQLEEAGVFVGEVSVSATRPSPFKRLLKKIGNRPMFRLPLLKPNRPIAARLLAPVQRLPPTLLGSVVLTWIIITTALVGTGLWQHALAVDVGEVFWPLVIVGFLTHMAIHEFGHAITASFFGVTVREVGVGLLYYVIPMAYIDRTDSYRIRSFRHQAYISLAGPTMDMSAAAFSAVMLLTMHGWVAATFHVLFLSQCATAFSNVNPFIPSDGYHAAEALMRGLNYRRRAMSLFKHRITFRKLPEHLRGMIWWKQILGFIYGGFALFYTTLLILGIVSAVVSPLIGLNGAHR